MASQHLNAAEKDQICVKCRDHGHGAKQCAEKWPQGIWHLTLKRQRYLYQLHMSPVSGGELCERCTDADIISMLEPGVNQITQYELGIAEDLVLVSGCSVCRCLAAICPSISYAKAKLTMTTQSALFRVEGVIDPSREEFCNVAKTLSIQVDFNESKRIQDVGADDTLCLVADSTQTIFGARLVQPDRINTCLVHDWVSACSQNHPTTCRIRQDHQLKSIALIDVETRYIVPYPVNKQTEYLALSYCWGDVVQHRYDRHSRLPNTLPRTIEDAITLVGMLGKRYLWVDSICIDQGNETPKMEQIGLMNLIYQGSWLTIIALSSTSADDGLPRVSNEIRVTPQIQCTIAGRQLVNTGMNLSMSIFVQEWGRRSWTLQEALLSSRCLYLNDEQMHFECNDMQCCESLDDSQSYMHHVLRDEAFMKDLWNPELIGSGVLRAPKRGKGRLHNYSTLVSLYSRRMLTHQSDGLNAFVGILRFLEELAYPKGFFWGLPLEDMNWALCWIHPTPIPRRQMFPEWSWCGWNGLAYGGYPRKDHMAPHRYPVLARIWKLHEGTLQLLFQQDVKQDKEGVAEVRIDAYVHFCKQAVLPAESTPSTVSTTQYQLLLSAVAISLEKIRGWWHVYTGTDDSSIEDGTDADVWTRLSIGGVSCGLYSTGHVLEQIFTGRKEQPVAADLTFLVLAREGHMLGEDAGLIHHLLVIRKDSSGFARRVGCVELWIPMDQLEALEQLQMIVQQVTLV